jgi:glycosyltransferase involved in cell wall biosynthesis
MNILHVSNFFKPAWSSGGVANAAYQIGLALQNSGHEITIFTTDGLVDDDIPTNRMTSVDGMDTVYFENLSEWIASSLKISNPPAAIPISRQKITEFDIIHIHEHRTLLALTISHYANKYGIPYVVQPHGSFGYDRGKKYLKKGFDSVVGNRIINNSKRVIATSEVEKRELSNHGVPDEKIDIIPIGIHPDEVSHNIKDGDFKERLGIDHSDPVILYLGRLDRIKGVDRLVKSFGNIHDLVSSDVKLVIVGPDKGIKQKLIEYTKNSDLHESVIFAGPRYGSEKYEAFNDADLYVLPSRFDCFPTTVLEAGLMNTPVLLSNQCWTASTFAGKDAAVSFKCNNRELDQRLIELLDSQEKRQRLADNLNSLVIDRYTWEEITIDIQSIYADILANETNKQI